MSSLLKIITDTNCEFYKDSEYIGNLTVNEIYKIEFRKGTYILEFISIENKNIQVTQEYTMQSNDEEDLLRVYLNNTTPLQNEYEITVIDSQQKLFNKTENIIINLPYDEFVGIKLNRTDSHFSYYFAKQAGLWGIINNNGIQIISPRFKSYHSYGVLFKNYLYIKDAGKFYIFTLKGIELNYEDVGYFMYGSNDSKEKYKKLKLSGKWGVVDSKLDIVIDFNYDNIEMTIDGYFVVKSDKKFGIIGVSEIFDTYQVESILPIIYDEIFDISVGFIFKYILVRSGSRYYFIDKSGNYLSKVGYSFAEYFQEGLAIVNEDEERFHFIDLLGKTIVPPIYDVITSFFVGEIGFVKKSNDGLWAAINNKGQLLTGFEISSFDRVQDLKYACVKLGDKFEFINSNGSKLTNNKYDNVGDYSNDKPFIKHYLTQVKKDGKWGCINRQCELVIPLDYEYIDDFYECNNNYLAIAYKDNKKGIIDEKNNVIIPFEYSNITIGDDNIFRGSYYCKNTSEAFIYNAQKSKKSNYYILFDTETTGLKNNNANSLQPRLVQLAWLLCNEDGDILLKRNEIIFSNEFLISDESVLIHGITNEIALKKGKPVRDVLDTFFSYSMYAEIIIGHNIDFDKSIIDYESKCISINNPLNEIKSICTMKSSTFHCKIKNEQGNGYKYPTLSELHRYIFGKSFEGQHNAMNDVLATFRCFQKLVENGIINTKNSRSDSLPF